MSVIAEKFLSEEEYLKLEDESVDERREYVDGILRLMAGTTQEHNDIVQNFVLKLTLLAREQKCRLAVETIRSSCHLVPKKDIIIPTLF